MLNAKRLGVSGGIIWGLGVFAMTWANLYFGYAPKFIELLADIYPGYEATPIGSLIGLGYGFLDMGIFLFILAWLNNKLKI